MCISTGPMVLMLEHRQVAALYMFVRVVAPAEGVAEVRRRRLAESWEFLPREVFIVLQSKSASPYSCLTAAEIYAWLIQQFFCTSMFTVDDVAEAILPLADVYGELRYEGSLRMVLPSQVPVEMMCRLTHLFVHGNRHDVTIVCTSKEFDRAQCRSTVDFRLLRGGNQSLATR